MIAIIFDAGIGVLTAKRLKKQAVLSGRELEAAESGKAVS